MYVRFGLHHSKYAKYRKLVVEKKYTNEKLKQEFGLTDQQSLFLFKVLLQGKYNKYYKPPKVDVYEEGVRVWSPHKELGEGVITQVFSDNNSVLIEFEYQKLPVMCSTEGYTIHDDIKRKFYKYISLR